MTVTGATGSGLDPVRWTSSERRIRCPRKRIKPSGPRSTPSSAPRASASPRSPAASVSTPRAGSSAWQRRGALLDRRLRYELGAAIAEAVKLDVGRPRRPSRTRPPCRGERAWRAGRPRTRGRRPLAPAPQWAARGGTAGRAGRTPRCSPGCCGRCWLRSVTSRRCRRCAARPSRGRT